MKCVILKQDDNMTVCSLFQPLEQCFSTHVLLHKQYTTFSTRATHFLQKPDWPQLFCYIRCWPAHQSSCIISSDCKACLFSLPNGRVCEDGDILLKTIAILIFLLPFSLFTLLFIVTGLLFYCYLENYL